MQDRGLKAEVISWLFTSVAICMVTLRLISRVYLKKLADWDDVFLVLALILTILTASLGTYAISLGMGKHIYDLPHDVEIKANRWGVVANAVSLFTFTVAKLPVAVLLDRILSISSPLQRVFLYVPAVFTIAFAIALCGVYLGQCQPLSGLWSPEGATCLAPHIYRDLSLSFQSTSSAMDFFYAFYPMWFISKLHMELRRKLRLSMVLGLGCVGGSVSVWKTVTLPVVFEPNADATYAYALLFLATIVEASCLMIACCIPTIGPVVHTIKEKVTNLSSKFSSDVRTYQQFDNPGQASHPQAQAWAFARGARPNTANSESTELQSLAPDQSKSSRRRGNAEQIAVETTMDVSLSA